MKRRRRTNKDVPAKGRLRDMADKLWSVAVRRNWGNKCAVCGAKKVESHHLVPRQFEATRYKLQNGIALCPNCHKFRPDLSPHQNSAAWLGWLRDFHPGLLEWYWENPRPRFAGTKNAAHYCDVLRELRKHVEPEEFRSIVGKKFSEWLET